MISRPVSGDVPVENLVQLLIRADTQESRNGADRCLTLLCDKVQSGESVGSNGTALRERFLPVVRELLRDGNAGSLRFTAAVLAASWKDSPGYETARMALDSRQLPEATRVRAFHALISAGEGNILAIADRILTAPGESAAFRGQLLAALGRLDDPQVAKLVLESYPRMEPELKPRAIELLTQRSTWSIALLNAIRPGAIAADAVNLNQVRRLSRSKDDEVRRLVRERWGLVRDERNPQREQVIRDVREVLRKTPGDPGAGKLVFARVCAQCHKIYGEGQDVGPEITLNGRGSYEQLLSNVFDPSLVIGSAYQGTTVATTDGRILSGLLIERSAARAVLRMQGGETKTIPGDQIDEVKLSPLSLMPEDLEKQLAPQELADLFAFLSLDRPPDDPSARRLPGAEELADRRPEE
jgi:putative heme-binding domain-containing protein